MMVIGSSNVPLRGECQGRGAMPSRVSEKGNVAEAEDALGMRMALRLCSLADDHQDFSRWLSMPPLLPQGDRP